MVVLTHYVSCDIQCAVDAHADKTEALSLALRTGSDLERDKCASIW